MKYCLLFSTAFMMAFSSAQCAEEGSEKPFKKEEMSLIKKIYEQVVEGSNLACCPFHSNGGDKEVKNQNDQEVLEA